MIKSYTDIEGWFDFQDIYDEAVKRFPEGSVFVEIGTYLGRSTAYMAQAIKESGKLITFSTIDTFESDPALPHKPSDTRERFLQAMNDLDVAHYVISFCGKSVDMAHVFNALSIDFLFIDGAHDYETVKAELNAYLPKMNPSGIIAGHDYLFPGVGKAVNEMFKTSDIQILGSSWVVQLNNNKP